LPKPFARVKRVTHRQARERSITALIDGGIAGAQRRSNDYPHHLSGDLLQRMMIAIAMACHQSLW
jgi:peptide/nickel transport system ATP-binding protein